MAAEARPEMNMKHFWQRQLLLPLLLKHSKGCGRAERGGGVVVTQISYNQNQYGSRHNRLGQVNCLQLCLTRAKSFPSKNH